MSYSYSSLSIDARFKMIETNNSFSASSLSSMSLDQKFALVNSSTSVNNSCRDAYYRGLSNMSVGYSSYPVSTSAGSSGFNSYNSWSSDYTV